MSFLDGQRLYVDTNVFIYLAERHPIFGPTARALFQAAHEGQFSLLASELALAEALVLPFKLDQKLLQDQFIETFSPRRSFEIIAVSRDILIASARIRASVGNNLPDVIHIASAVAAGCAVYISEDKGIRPPDGLQVVTLSNLSTMLPST